MYNQSESIEKAVMISVSLLKHQNLESLSTLKKLLTFIPNPVDIQEVWRKAICEIIKTSPQTSYWLFQHPDCLKPEVNVREILIEELSQKLLSWGFSSEDFCFNSQGKLAMNSTTAIPFMNPNQFSPDEPALVLMSYLLVESPCCHD